MANLNDATPRVIHFGMQDNSATTLPVENESIPQAVSLFYVFAQKGTKKRFFGSSAAASSQFGSETFDKESKYFQHTTKLRNYVVGKGGACVIHRVVPDDAGVKANIALYADVLHTHVPNYKRNSTGMHAENALQQKELNPTQPYIDGYYIKWYKKSVSDVDAEYLGGLTPEDGTMAKWKMAPEGEVHVTVGESNNIEGTASGHTNWANKTVFTYDTAEDIWNPTYEVTTRTKYTVDDSGDRTLVGTETFGTDPDTVTKSTLYPIFETRAQEQGEWYNLVGFSIESLTGDKVSTKITKGLKALPYNFYIYNKPDKDSSPKIFSNLYGESSTQFSFVENAVNPVTEGSFGFEYTVKNMYYNETSTKLPLKYKDLEGIHFYRANFETILKNVVETEKMFADTIERQDWEDGEKASTFSWYDFISTSKVGMSEEFGMINPFVCKTSKKVPYYTLMVSGSKAPLLQADLNEVTMGYNTPIFLENGSDGTMTQDVLEKAVIADMANYLDTDSEYMDLARHVETHLYDSGFELDTKKALVNFIAVRKDTFLLLCTNYASMGEKQLSLSDQRAIGLTLKASIQLAPESEEFGTSVCRCAVVVGTGKEDGSDVRVPLSYDVAGKIVKLMGGGDKKWKPIYLFDKSPNNVIEDFSDIQPEFVPESTKTTLWDTGLIYPQAKGLKTFFFPAMKTVYEDSTSIANSLINVLVLSHCERSAFTVWSNVTGDMSQPDAVFLADVQTRLNKAVAGVFGNILTVKGEAVMNEADKTRGFSWHANYKIYGNVMKTLQIYSSQMYRTSALDSTTK